MQELETDDMPTTFTYVWLWTDMLSYWCIDVVSSLYGTDSVCKNSTKWWRLSAF